MTPNSRERGQYFESRVLLHLQSAGLTLVTRNYQCKVGEIDLIMSDANALVFVEVRFRQSGALVDGLNSVGQNKRTRFIKAVKYFLLCHPDQAQRDLRFDVVSVSEKTLDWQKNAFDAGHGW
jgi:putative endonuclease